MEKIYKDTYIMNVSAKDDFLYLDQKNRATHDPKTDHDLLDNARTSPFVTLKGCRWANEKEISPTASNPTTTMEQTDAKRKRYRSNAWKCYDTTESLDGEPIGSTLMIPH